MQYSVPNELLARDFMDRMAARRSQVPDWLTSAVSYPPPAHGAVNQQDWPVPQTRVGPGTDNRAALDGGAWDAGNKGGQDAPRTRYDIGRGRAALLGAMQGVSADFGDELAGGYAAGSLSGVNARRPVGMALQTFFGLARLGYETLRGQRGSATEAYERGRDQVRVDAETASQQYPGTYYTANVAAGAAVPASRVAQAATLPMRMRRAALAGGVFGGLSGVGGGETPSDRAIQGVIGAGSGGAIGAGVGAVAPAVIEGARRAGRAIARGIASRDDAVSPMITDARNAPHVRASRTPAVYDPPPYPQRPFTDDYRHGARADAAGNLTHDMDGRPLHAEFVFGRRTKDGSDVGMRPWDYSRLTKALMGKGPIFRSDMQPGLYGETSFGRAGRMTEMALRTGMSMPDTLRVYAHELGHGIDEFVRRIPVEQFMRELRPLYNTLNNPSRTADGRNAASGRMITPRDNGYRDAEGLREYAAEAIRMYLTRPNYIKSVAPQTAAMIRKWVNEHPALSRIIQFNSLLAAPAAGLVRRPEQAESGL